MKKIISIMLGIILIFICTVSYALDEVVNDGEKENEEEINIDLNLKSSKDSFDIENSNIVTLTLSLANLKGIPDEASIGYEATVEYDKNIFQSLTIKGLNNWYVKYEESTGILLCELVGATVSNNLEMAEFTLTLKEEAQIGETTVKLTGEEAPIITAQYDNLEEPEKSMSYEQIEEKSVTINIVRTSPKEEPKDETEKNEDDQGEKKEEQGKEQAGNQQNTDEQPKVLTVTQPPTTNAQTPQNTTNTDNTTAKTSMPSTGLKTIFIVLIIIAFLGIIYLIKYKSIKLK